MAGIVRNLDRAITDFGCAPFLTDRPAPDPGDKAGAVHTASVGAGPFPVRDPLLAIVPVVVDVAGQVVGVLDTLGKVLVSSCGSERVTVVVSPAPLVGHAHDGRLSGKATAVLVAGSDGRRAGDGIVVPATGNTVGVGHPAEPTVAAGIVQYDVAGDGGVSQDNLCPAFRPIE